MKRYDYDYGNQSALNQFLSVVEHDVDDFDIPSDDVEINIDLYRVFDTKNSKHSIAWCHDRDDAQRLCGLLNRDAEAMAYHGAKAA